MFNPSAIDNAWEFDDHVRRNISRLSDDEHLSKPRRARNRIYREAILHLIEGLATESPFEVSEAFELIASQFHLTQPDQPPVRCEIVNPHVVPFVAEPTPPTPKPDPFAGIGGTDDKQEEY
jgi:hypothetical protein